jgi:hypothetical protein
LKNFIAKRPLDGKMLENVLKSQRGSVSSAGGKRAKSSNSQNESSTSARSRTNMNAGIDIKEFLKHYQQ